MDAEPLEETLRDLARESGRTLAELGVRATDERWIRDHAETLASLRGRSRASRLSRLWNRFFVSPLSFRAKRGI